MINVKMTIKLWNGILLEYIFNFQKKMMFKRFLHTFSKSSSISTFSANKYMKSVTETALLYRPENIINLDLEQNIKDRVVQAFFDSSNFQIGVTEAQERLKDITSYSTPSHSYYQINLPF